MQADLIIADDGTATLIRDIKVGETIYYENEHIRKHNYEFCRATSLMDLSKGCKLMAGHYVDGKVAILSGFLQDDYLCVKMVE